MTTIYNSMSSIITQRGDPFPRFALAWIGFVWVSTRVKLENYKLQNIKVGIGLRYEMTSC